MNRWGVKSATLEYGGTTYDMASGPAGKSETRDAIDVTALSENTKHFITGALKEVDEFTVTLFQGVNDITVDTAPASAMLSVVLENGVDSDTSISVGFNNLIVTKVAYPAQDASGDRKGTYDVTFRPDGTSLSA